MSVPVGFVVAASHARARKLVPLLTLGTPPVLIVLIATAAFAGTSFDPGVVRPVSRRLRHAPGGGQLARLRAPLDGYPARPGLGLDDSSGSEVDRSRPSGHAARIMTHPSDESLLALAVRARRARAEGRRRRRRGDRSIGLGALGQGAARRARAGRRGRPSLGRYAGDEGQAGRAHVDLRSHPRGPRSLRRRRARARRPLAGRSFRRPGRSERDRQRPFPDLDLFDPAMGELDAGKAIAIARAAEDAARAFDPRITNSEGATFSRTAGAVALVLSGGFRGGYRGLVRVALRRPGRRRRGRQEAPRLPLDRQALPGRARRSRGGRTRGRAAHAAQARREARSRPARRPVVFDPDAARSILGTVRGLRRWAAPSGASRATSSAARAPRSRARSSRIVDDPLIPRAPGSRPFDGEGLLGAQERASSSSGVLKTYLCDSYSARKLGRASTGSAVARRRAAASGARRRTSSSSRRRRKRRRSSTAPSAASTSPR